MKKTTAPKVPYIITTDGWISLVIPAAQARLTTARGGEKASGPVPRNVFDAWCKLVVLRAPGPVTPSPNLTDGQNKAIAEIMNQPKGTLGFDRRRLIQGFLDHLEAIWPGHSTPVEIPVFTPGQDVAFDFGPRKGPDKGKVEKVKGASVVVRFEREGLISMSALTLAR